MNDAALQVLLILVYLSVGLFSVVFPIFAISVNFLPQEKWEGEKERRKKIEELRRKILAHTASLKGEKQDSARATELRKEIARYENELESPELRSQYLSAKGAVGIPIVLLAFALIFAGVGIYCYYEGTQNQLVAAQNYVAGCAFVSGLLITLAAASMYRTVSAVELAALRTGKTVDFEIGFDTELATAKTVKVGESSVFGIGAKTIESDVERWTIVANLPKALGLLPKPKKADIVFGDFPDHNSITMFREFIPKGYLMGVNTEVKPETVGEYVIKVTVIGRGICTVTKDLVLKVVK